MAHRESLEDGYWETEGAMIAAELASDMEAAGVRQVVTEMLG
jgi:hypothetical protein